MSRYIDAEELKSAIRKVFHDLGMRIDINSVINIQPTADVIPIEWIKEQMAECTPYSIQWLSIRFLLEDWERREDDKGND